jgi:hypothetical protein
MPGKRIAISQSNYIPWKGYFDMIRSVDEFVLYDDVQYTRRDWRNRNKVKTPQGLKWLTIPVTAEYYQPIREVEAAEENWNLNHWQIIRHSYKQAAGFDAWAEPLEALYVSATHKRLSEINYHFLNGINNMLGIDTPLTSSSVYRLEDGKTERLLSICMQAGASVYLSGPAAKGYLQEELFEQQGISVEWMKYDQYPVYPQLHGEFTHQVSILDLMLNTGYEAAAYF